ncbi:MAG: hypothetical protein AB7I50_12475 [Vicinamibacterales bacterium]
MASSTPDTVTIGVFQDAVSAALGISALQRHAFTPDMLSVVARRETSLDAIVGQFASSHWASVTLPRLGDCVMAGLLGTMLEGEGALLASSGLAGCIRSVGFQAHDGRIFEMLLERGGVLVAVQSEPRAADALALLHAYGAGNAAIGAWHGRL